MRVVCLSEFNLPSVTEKHYGEICKIIREMEGAEKHIFACEGRELLEQFVAGREPFWPKTGRSSSILLMALVDGSECLERNSILEEKEKVVGLTTVVGLATLARTKAQLEDVVTDSEHRNMGIGRALVETGLAVCREVLHAEYVDLTSAPFREAANHLYQSVGFQRRNTNVYRFIF